MPGEEGGGGEGHPVAKVYFSLTGGHDFDEAWVSDVRDGVATEAEAGVGVGAGDDETHRAKV